MLALRTLDDDTAGFTVLEVLLAVVVLIVLAFAIHFIFHDRILNEPRTGTSAATSTSTTTSTPAVPVYTILSPATVASKTPECSQQISFAGNGDSGPVTCANGDLNVLEWNALSGLEPTVMTLGYNATLPQVQSALCADANASNSDANTKNSFAIEATVYQISALYYGWQFPSNPSVVLSNGTC